MIQMRWKLIKKSMPPLICDECDKNWFHSAAGDYVVLQFRNVSDYVYGGGYVEDYKEPEWQDVEIAEEGR